MATTKFATFQRIKYIIYSTGRSIMTTNIVKAKKLLESLKDNPYFDKYAASIARLQQTNPEEFIARIEANENKQRENVQPKDPETTHNFDCKSANAKPTLSSNVQGINSTKLSDVMKVELLENKGKDDIIDIWLDYHKNRDCIAGVMESKLFDTMFETGAKYPVFILPLPRKNGYEFILSQFSGTEVHMTPLLFYQTHHENAPECLKIVHFTDLRESKNIILMKGEFDTNMLSVQEAQCLANELQLYYAQNNKERENLLKTFTNTPDNFKYMNLISQLETINLTSSNVFNNYSSLQWLWGYKKNQRHCEIKKSHSHQLQLRKYGNYDSKFTYITTPIFYVNAAPHIGHLYSATLADALARYNKMLGHRVFLTTGTDEHGNKVRNAALANNLSPEQYCNQISGMFKKMSDSFDVEYNDFIRTTESRHHEAVQHFWTKLYNKGHIYLGEYSGWYCMSDEAFVSEVEIEDKKDTAGNITKVCSASGNSVEWMEEDNYKFRLSSFQGDLKYWLRDPHVVRPAKYHKILSTMIEEECNLKDLSISRPISRVPWGIKVPNDDSQTIYVWLDALVNYLTSVGYPNSQFSSFWPPKIQVIGKDILKFHGIYWPAFLIAAGLDPPAKLLCHSHWTVCDEKMSKSKGNVVSPDEAANLFTTNGLRYFLLREAVPHNDANYGNEKICNILNTELANTLGNLLNRCMAKAINSLGIIPEPKTNDIDILNSKEAQNVIHNLKNLSTIAETAYNEYNLHHLVDAVMQTLFVTNKMIDYHKPWILVKEIDVNDKAQLQLNAIIALSLESVRISSLILLPIIPQLISNLLDVLNVPPNARMWSNTEYLNTGRNIMNSSQVKRENILLFRRIKVNN